jgi:hypothetical protein
MKKILWIAAIVVGLLVGGGWLVLKLWFTENLKELWKQKGWTTFFIRWWEKWRHKLCWQRVRGLWWLWLIFGLSGGGTLMLWVTPASRESGPEVKQWLVVSDAATVKAVVPAEMFADWESNTHTADDLTRPDAKQRLVPKEMLQDVETAKHKVEDLSHQLNEQSAQQLDYAEKPPSPPANIGELPLQLRVQRAQREQTEAEARVSAYFDPKVNKAVNDRIAAEARVDQYLRQLLATGKIIARGIPNEAPPHDNEQIIIKPAQWQYLRISISTGDATDTNKVGPVFRGVEIGRPKG